MDERAALERRVRRLAEQLTEADATYEALRAQVDAGPGIAYRHRYEDGLDALAKSSMMERVAELAHAGGYAEVMRTL